MFAKAKSATIILSKLCRRVLRDPNISQVSYVRPASEQGATCLYSAADSRRSRPVLKLRSRLLFDQTSFSTSQLCFNYISGWFIFIVPTWTASPCLGVCGLQVFPKYLPTTPTIVPCPCISIPASLAFINLYIL